MQATAQKLESTPATPHLQVVQASDPRPRQEIITYGQPCAHSWQSMTTDGDKLYSQDGRWCGGRFILWTLESYSPYRGMEKKRGGYWDAKTGVYFYGERKDQQR